VVLETARRLPAPIAANLGRVQLDHLADGQRDALAEAADCR
jgi:hypothetical protein